MQMDKGIENECYSTFKRVRYFSCVVYCVCRYHAKSRNLVFSFAPLSTSAISQVKCQVKEKFFTVNPTVNVLSALYCILGFNSATLFTRFVTTSFA